MGTFIHIGKHINPFREAPTTNVVGVVIGLVFELPRLVLKRLGCVLGSGTTFIPIIRRGRLEGRRDK